MGMRILLCFLLVIIFFVSGEKGINQNLLELKLSVVSFSLPYYLFILVGTSVLFSMHTFYTNLRKLLFPQLKERDDNDFVQAMRPVGS